MSLWWWDRRITAAVVGDLPVAAEAKLRAHLRGCPECRAAYDERVRAAEALGLAAGPRRERARLMAALESPGSVAPPRRLRRWAPALLVPAVAVLLLWARPRPAEEPDVGWRGAGEEATAPVRLLVHASRKEPDGTPGPVRLVADLPGAGEGRAALGDYLQLGYRGLEGPAHVAVFAVDEAGAAHQWVPRPGAAPPRVDPAAETRGLGPSIDLGRRHRAGRLRVYAVFSPAPLDLAQLSRAAARAPALAPLPVEGITVAGLLVIDP